jgi:superkiller protein 3
MEQEAVDKEIAKRRMRLGANLEQVTRDVKREIYSKSDVSPLFSSMTLLISARNHVPAGNRLD